MPFRRYSGALPPVPFKSPDEFTDELLTQGLGPELRDVVALEGARLAAARPDPNLAAADPALADMSEFGKGLGAGWESTKAAGYGMASLAGDIAGYDPLRDWGIEGYLERTAEAEKYAPRVGSYSDITGLEDFGDWAAYGLGQLAPFAATSIAGGGLGGLAVRGAAQAAGKRAAAKYVGSRLQKDMAQAAANKVLQRGALAGIAPTTMGTEAGLLQGDIYRETGQTDPWTALAGGVAAGALDVLPQARIVEQVLQKPAKSILRDMGIQALVEGATEGTQTGIERLTVKAAGGKEDVLTKEGVEEMVNAALIGALGGATISGATGVGKRILDRGESDQGAARPRQAVPAGQPTIKPIVPSVPPVAGATTTAQPQVDLGAIIGRRPPALDQRKAQEVVARKQAKGEDAVAFPHPTIPGKFVVGSQREASDVAAAVEAAMVRAAEQQAPPVPGAHPVAEMTPETRQQRIDELKRLATESTDLAVKADLGRQASILEAEARGEKPVLTAQERRRRALAPDPERDSLDLFLRKLGGLNTSGTKSDASPTADWRGRLKHLNKQGDTFILGLPGIEQGGENGLTLDEAAEAAFNAGFIDNYDWRELEPLLERMERGDKIFSKRATEVLDKQLAAKDNEAFRQDREQRAAAAKPFEEMEELRRSSAMSDEEMSSLTGLDPDDAYDELPKPERDLSDLMVQAAEVDADAVEALSDALEPEAFAAELRKIIEGVPREQAAAPAVPAKPPVEEAAQPRVPEAPVAGARAEAQPVERPAAEVAPSPAKEDDLEQRATRRYQWMANREGGQREGNREIIVQVDEEIYERYVKRLQRPGFAKDFSEYRRKVGQLFASFVKRSDEDTWRLSKVDTEDALEQAPQDPRWVREVSSFDTAEARSQATTFDSDLDRRAHEAATSPRNDLPEPTEPQIGAGNYKKGHVRVHGLDVSIENPQGSKRRPEWPDLTHHYGYIRGTKGKDKEHVDAFIGPNPDSERVFVVDQRKTGNGQFDEHKVMLGFNELEQARQAYLSNYPDDWKGLKTITEAKSLDDFKTWAADAQATQRPFAESTAAKEAERGKAEERQEAPEVPAAVLGQGGASVEKIHALADARGIAWDNDPEFMAFTRNMTGKEHLDDASAEDLSKLADVLSQAPDYDTEGVVALQLEGGKRALMHYTPNKFAGFSHFQLHGKATSPTGYRSHFAAIQSRDEPFVDAAQRVAQAIADEASKKKQPKIKKIKPVKVQVEGAAPEPAPSVTPTSAPAAEYGSTNKVFTAAAADAARERLRKKLGTLRAGIDPEMMQDGITLAGYHVEAGARSFADFSKAMVADMGESIRKYLRYLYRMVRDYPDFDATGMQSEQEIDAGGPPVTGPVGFTRSFPEPEPPAISSGIIEPEVPANEQPEIPPEPARPEAGERPGGRGPRRARQPDRGQMGGLFPESGEETGVGGTATAGGEGRTRAGAQGERPGEPGAVDGRDREPAAARPERPASGVVEQPTDHVITDEDAVGQGGEKQKAKDNIEAIRLVKTLESEDRKATSEERRTLVKYVGWGGLKGVFDADNKKWSAEHAELKGLLTDEEFAAARRSMLDAHYTSPEVIGAMWGAVARMGFNGGRVLEPSMGVGHFFGLMPADVRANSTLLGVELDRITGAIAKQLYQKAEIASPMGFQEVVLPSDNLDLVIGNPPFGSQTLYDKNHPDLRHFSIHNFFFAKALDKLRPGGIMQMVVSRYLLDSTDVSARKHLAERAKLIGAVRLPYTAFLSNAGTEVVTDIVVLQKLAPGETADQSWVGTGEIELAAKDGGKHKFSINRYFLDHPEMVIGLQAATGKMYTGNQYNVEPDPARPLVHAMGDAFERFPENIFTPAERPAEPEQQADPEESTDTGHAKVYGYFETPSGELRQRTVDDFKGKAQSIKPEFQNEKVMERARGMVRVRDALKELMSAEISDKPEDEISRLRRKLNMVYNGFRKEYGFINGQSNRRAFAEDPDLPLLESLEPKYDPGVSAAVAAKRGIPVRQPSAERADIFTKRVRVPQAAVTKVGTAEDALKASMNMHGRVNPEYMAGIYGKPWDEIAAELGGMVFHNPAGGWESADEYLSGNVKAKLKEAEEASSRQAEFGRNVDALRAVQPADVPALKIAVRLGSPWIPASDISNFITGLIEAENPRINYLTGAAKWEVKIRHRNPVAATQTWGTGRVPAEDVLESLLNSKQIVVKDNVGTRDQPIYVVNEVETEAARAKSADMSAKFKEWIWADQDRRQRLERYYNDHYNTDVDRKHDGKHLTLPGKSSLISLREHQLNAVWRGIQDRTVLLDHVVGAGKTFEMGAIAMELRRLGIARKPMFVVPNHLVRQWRDEIYKLYPNANVLAATEADFQKANRQRFFGKIATGDWDAVIVAHSSFKRIATPAETEREILQEQLDDIVGEIERLKRERGDRNVVRDMERIREKLEGRMASLAGRTGAKDEVADFAELGVDALFVDEAHGYKNLFYMSQMRGVAGLGNPEGSGRAFDLFVKVQFLNRRFNNRAPIVFATGTPISNSLVEMYTMQRYLSWQKLRDEGLHHLDAWAGTFGDVQNIYEVHPSGTGYRLKTRFAKFVNLPALMSVYRSFADVITMDDLKRQAAAAGDRFPVPKIKGGRPLNVVSDRSEQQTRFFGVAEFKRTPEGEILFKNPKDLEPKRFDEPNRQGWFLVSPETRATYAGPFETEQEATTQRDAIIDVPDVGYNEESILWSFENLSHLRRMSNNRINALSITNRARKGGLDYRLIDPSAPDFAGSKINRSVDEIKRIYDQWADDRGTQLVFCDQSVPASARASAAVKEKDAYVRGPDGSLERVKATIVQLEAFPIAFLAVKRGKQFTIYEGTRGVDLGITSEKKADAITQLEKALEGKDWLTGKVGDTAEITDDEINEFVTAQEQDEEGTGDGAEDAISFNDLNAMGGKGRFSVYDDMKAKLVAKGIPEKEVAFIHDYDTAAKKAALFKEVRDGRIRVLLGSTEKMGAGMNVQDRLVALHHLDAPWRPSDLEQREGRIVRQGNQLYARDPDGFEVEIFRYATKQTYDTRMWQLIEHKAAGIEQLRKADRTLLEIDDVGGEEANAADMKAAASGNPAILEEIRLRNEVKSLEAQQYGHQSATIQAQDRIRELERAPGYAEDYATRMKPFIDAAKPVGTEADVFRIRLGGKDYTDKADATGALMTAFVDAAKASAIGSKMIGTYRGLRLNAGRGFSNVYFELQAEGQSQTVASYSGDEKFSAPGLLTRMDNALKSVEGNVEARRKQAQDGLKLVPQFRAEIDKPFPKADDLKQKREAHRAVVAQLAKSGGGIELTPAMRTELEAAVAKRHGTTVKESKATYGVAEDVGETPTFKIGRARLRPEKAQTGMLSQADVEGRYATKTQLVTSATRYIGAVPKIKTPVQAAQAYSYLASYADERFDAIVTDKDDKPLAIVGGFKGTIDGASVYAPVILKDALSIPGAANVWFAHNHPSGLASFSSSDRTLHARLIQTFKGTQVAVRGHILIGGKAPDGGLFFQYENQYGDIEFPQAQVIKPPEKVRPLAVVEREIVERGSLGLTLDSPTRARNAISSIANGQAGVMFVDNQHVPVAFVPLTEEQVKIPLRGSGRMDAVIRSVARANGAAAFIYTGRGAMSAQVANNLASMLKNIEVRVLDIFDETDSFGGPLSWVETRRSFGDSSFQSRARETVRRGGMAPDDVQKIADAVAANLPSAPRIFVVERADQLPEEKRGKADNATEGLVVDGQLYLFAHAIATPARAAWVIAHELKHAGLLAAYGDELDAALADAEGNNFIKRLADAIASERQREGMPLTRLNAVNEAIAELDAAIKTDDFGHINDRYGIAVPASFRKGIAAAIARFFEAVRRVLNGIMGEERFSNDDVRSMLEASEQALREGPQAPVGEPAMSRQASSERFRRWFAGSVVTDEAGSPMIVYRGEHGLTDQQIHSRHGSISFGSKEAANTYAQFPNRATDKGEAPRVIPAYLSIKNPVIDNRKDPFIDFTAIIDAIGLDKAVKIAKDLDTEIEGLGLWMDDDKGLRKKHGTVKAMLNEDPGLVRELYVDAYHVFNNKDYVEWFRDAGYDGAIHIGNGETHDDVEYKVFSTDQIKSAIGNRGTYAPGPDILQSSQAPVWNSALERTITAKMGDREPASELLKKLDGWQKGGAFKAEELEWSGIKEWLAEQDGRVTREQVQEFLRENEILVEEKLLSDSGASPNDPAIFEDTFWLQNNGFEVERNPEGTMWGVVDLEGDIYTDPEDLPTDLPSDARIHARAVLEYLNGSGASLDRLNVRLTELGFEQLRDDMERPHIISGVTTSRDAPQELIDEYQDYWRDRGITDLGSAEEMVADRRSTDADRKWLTDYIRRWDESLHQDFYSDGDGNFADPDTGERPPEEVERIARRIGELQELAEAAADERNHDPYTTRYSRLTIPGAKEGSYRELLLTLPAPMSESSLEAGAKKLFGRPYENLGPGEMAQVNQHIWNPKPIFRSSHFDEPNILAHVRFNERTDADGKRVLFIEEVQSDWHQRGRKQGYAGDKAPTKQDLVEPLARALEADDNLGFDRTSEALRAIANHMDFAERWEMSPETVRLANEYRNAPDGGRSVPNAPFKTTWPMLVMKRMLRYAADGGYDRIAWTPGSVQVDRYDLGKHIGILMVGKREDGIYSLSASGPRGGDIEGWHRKRATAEELPDLVGNDLADKIIKGEGGEIDQFSGARIYSGLDLRVGGEGMKGFYDDILPKEVGKYVKKWGGKVGQSEILTNPADGGGTPMRGAEYAKVHSLDVTPQMRESVSAGQPLFSRRPIDDDQRQAVDRAGLGWINQTFPERVADGAWERWRSFKNDVADRFVEGVFDRFLGLSRAEKEADVPAEFSATVAARMSTSPSSTLTAALMYGAPQWRDGIIQKKEGTVGLLGVLEPVREHLNEWTMWMVGKRAEYLAEQGRERNFSADDIAALIRFGDGMEEQFEQVAGAFREFNTSLLELARDAGLLTDRQVQDFSADEYYIPFYRVDENDDPMMPFTRRGLSHQTSGIRQLKGGRGRLNDPLANMFSNMGRLIESSMKNEALKRAVENIPDYFETAGEGDRAEPDVVRVMREGQPEYYHARDAALLRALQGITFKASPGWIKAFAMWTKNLLTGAVTADPAFMARNFVRDALHAWAISDSKFKVGIDSLRGAFSTIEGGEDIQAMMFAGASFMGGHRYGHDPKASAEALRRALRTKGFGEDKLATLVDSPLRFWQMYREFGDAVENANRVAIYQAAKRQGKSTAQAAFESKDIMDYSLRGNWEFVQTLTDVVPFLNARLQGLYRLGRSDMGSVAVRGSMIALASLGLLLANEDDKRYKELKDWEKDVFWHVFLGGQHYRIPKPFEIGVIFATGPERAYRLATGKDRLKDSLKSLVFNAGEVFAFNPTPQAVRPALEVLFNKKMFGWRPIEGLYEEGKLPEARYDNHTSIVMRELGAATGTSPKKLEHLWDGYLGAIGGYALSFADFLTWKAKGEKRPAPGLSDLPVVGSFVRSKVPYATRYGDEMYELIKEANQVQSTINLYRDRGMRKEASELVEENRGVLSMRGALNQARAQVSELRKQIAQVYDNKALSSQAKRERIDRLQEAINAIEQRSVERTRESDERAARVQSDTANMSRGQAATYFQNNGLPRTADLIRSLS